MPLNLDIAPIESTLPQSVLQGFLQPQVAPIVQPVPIPQLPSLPLGPPVPPRVAEATPLPPGVADGLSLGFRQAADAQLGPRVRAVTEAIRAGGGLANPKLSSAYDKFTDAFRRGDQPAMEKIRSDLADLYGYPSIKKNPGLALFDAVVLRGALSENSIKMADATVASWAQSALQPPLTVGDLTSSSLATLPTTGPLIERMVSLIQPRAAVSETAPIFRNRPSIFGQPPIPPVTSPSGTILDPRRQREAFLEGALGGPNVAPEGQADPLAAADFRLRMLEEAERRFPDQPPIAGPLQEITPLSQAEETRLQAAAADPTQVVPRGLAEEFSLLKAALPQLLTPKGGGLTPELQTALTLADLDIRLQAESLASRGKDPSTALSPQNYRQAILRHSGKFKTSAEPGTPEYDEQVAKTIKAQVEGLFARESAMNSLRQQEATLARLQDEARFTSDLQQALIAQHKASAEHYAALDKSLSQQLDIKNDLLKLAEVKGEIASILAASKLKVDAANISVRFMEDVLTLHDRNLIKMSPEEWATLFGKALKPFDVEFKAPDVEGILDEARAIIRKYLPFQTPRREPVGEPTLGSETEPLVEPPKREEKRKKAPEAIPKQQGRLKVPGALGPAYTPKTEEGKRLMRELGLE